MLKCSIYIFCFFAFLITNGVAQVSLSDSIDMELAKAESDTAKLNVYNRFIGSIELPHSKYYKKAQRLAAKQSDPIWLFRLDYSRAVRLMNQNKTKLSIATFEQLINQFNNKVEPTKVANVELLIAKEYNKVGELASSEKHADRSKKIFTSENDSNGLGRSNYFLSIIYRQTGRTQRALDVLDSALLQIDHEDLNMRASLYNSKGRLYRGLAVYDSARIYYERGLAIARMHNDSIFESKALNNLGNIAHSRGDLSDALSYYLNSLELKKKSKNERGIAVVYHNVGAVRVDLKSYEQALDDFRKSMELSNKTNYRTLIIHNFVKIGNCFREIEKLDSALVCHKQALNESNTIGFEAGKIDALIGLAEDEKRRQGYSIAVSHLLLAIDLAEKTGSRTQHGFALTSLAEVYIKMNRQSPLDEQKILTKFSDIDIEKLLKRAAQIAQETENYNGIETSLAALRTYYQDTKQYKQEVEIARRYIQFRDSLFNKQTAEAISELETKYKTAEREKEISILKKDKELQDIRAKTQKSSFIWLTILLVLLTLLGYTILRHKLKMRRIKQVDALRNQISSDLHDDVGSLLTGLSMQSELLEMTVAQENKVALQRIHEMSRSAMARIRDAVWAIDTSKDNWESLTDRMKDHAEDYIGPTEFEYSFSLNPIDAKNIKPEVRQQVFLIFKEAVANALKHSNGNKIVVSLEVNKKELRMTVNDNGTILPMKTSGVGISSMKRRAAQIGGQIIIKREDGFDLILVVAL